LADHEPVALVLLYLPLLIIGFFIWLGANQLASASETRTKSTSFSIFFLRLWPALLGAAPLFSAAMAELSSVPARFQQAGEGLKALINTPGSVWDKLDAQLARSAGEGLLISGYATLAAAMIFLLLCVLLSFRIQSFARKANERYFVSWRFLAISLALIILLTTVFLVFPVRLPQLLGVFGVISLFTLCIVGFCTHISLLSIRHEFPFFPIIFASAALFSILDLNDNHEIRLLQEASSSSEVDSVQKGFEKWYLSRPDRQAYVDEYPVYIVAAQGGGIYAAYQTGTFLARLQDICPAFRDHLFAISAVSGGSVGAAVFASGLQLTHNEGSALLPAGPCPQITTFLRREQPAPDMEQPKALETYVQRVLSPDFLSPLVAATLFPDFSQRFLPVRVPFLLDRATALEYALETAADNVSRNNLLKESYLSHWKSDRSSPALILNATDAASGRRVVLSPFLLGFRTSGDRAESLINFQTLRNSEKREERLNIRLSTAAVISARFPWITPAATVRTEDRQLFGPVNKIRLVDGGYIDNSGVETALSLKDALEPIIRSLNAEIDSKRVNRTNKAENYPRVVVKLIALSGGSYATRGSFALGETLEPIRALLSTRQSRAYVAINQAAQTIPPAPHSISVHGSDEVVLTRDFRVSNLENRYYDLPLGWSISGRTRDIIQRQSGRYWDCEFNRSFMQSSVGAGSETDCAQLSIYHELNQSLPSAIREVASANHYRELFSTQRGAPTIRIKDEQKNEIIRCYVDVNETWSLSQSHTIYALLDEWNYYPDHNDDRMLAYVLGTTAHETSEFRVFVQDLSYPSPERIYKIFRPRIASVEQAADYVNSPEKLANFFFRNRLGNKAEGDGWLYRPRGIFPLTGRDNYRHFGEITSSPLEEEPDLIRNRFVGSQVAFAVFFEKNILNPYFNDRSELWEEARRALPGLPVIDGVIEGAKEAAAKAKRFYGCIKRSMHQPSTR
jgi:predicted chitinase